MKIMPTEKQLRYLDWEFGAFFHFGIRTFNHGHRDWDGIEMPAETFNPTALDCRQWVRTVKEVGAKYAIMTTKHHDGFALWPSAYTKYSVAASPWKEGKGDVVREFTEACRAEGIAVGLYYSPAQWGSTAVLFERSEEYDDYFINQISELLTHYGKIDYLWFDGCGSGDHQYDQKRIIKVIRTLQPEITIFGMWDPDTMWVGNEEGYAPSDNTGLMNYEVLGDPEKLCYFPYECDCRIRDHWFYDFDAQTLKTVDELVGMYEFSVGRGANLLLNIGPDTRGLLPELDIARLKEWRAELDRRYSSPLPMQNIVKIDDRTYEISYSDVFYRESVRDTAYLPLVRSVILKEDITGGPAVRRFRLSAHLPSAPPYRDGRYSVFEGGTIGHKRICRFPAIRTTKFTLEILEADGDVTVTDMKAYGE